MTSESQIRDCLRRFAEAWARRDVDALLELMTDDAVYAASVGPEPGRTFRGRAELAAGLREMFAHENVKRRSERAAMSSPAPARIADAAAGCRSAAAPR